MGRPKSTNPRVFCAYRLPRATRDEIKRLAVLNTTPEKKCSEADVIVRAVGPKKMSSLEAAMERSSARAGMGMVPITRNPILKPSAKTL